MVLGAEEWRAGRLPGLDQVGKQGCPGGQGKHRALVGLGAEATLKGEKDLLSSLS